MKETKLKVIWAAVVVPADKEIIVIEPLRIKCKNGWFAQEAITVEGHLDSPEDFLKKVSELITKAPAILNEER